MSILEKTISQKSGEEEKKNLGNKTSEQTQQKYEQLLHFVIIFTSTVYVIIRCMIPKCVGWVPLIFHYILKAGCCIHSSNLNDIVQKAYILDLFNQYKA